MLTHIENDGNTVLKKMTNDLKKTKDDLGQLDHQLLHLKRKIQGLESGLQDLGADTAEPLIILKENNELVKS